MSWFTRLRNAMRPRHLEEELDEEMRDHLERRAAALRASGVADDEASRRARVRFGNATRLREESREARLTGFVEGTIQDVRYAFRLMRKQPGFTATIVVSLGLAIGANTAVFSILDAALLKPLPVTEPDRLIALTTPGITDPGRDAESERTTFSYPQLRTFRTAVEGSARLALFGIPGPTEVRGLEADSPIEQAIAQHVSGDAFGMLGVTAAAGRLIGPEDDRTVGAHAVVVLSYEYWQHRYGGDQSVIGRWIHVRGKKNQIIGVARQGFFGVEPGRMVQVWQPAMQYSKDAFENPGWSWFQVIGRLERGASIEQVASRLQPGFHDHMAAMVKRIPTLPEAIRKQFLESKVIVRAAPNGLSRFRTTYGKALLVVLGVALAILLIACSNVASLLLARAASRATEVAMRVSLGAGRIRLIRQLLTESLLYAFAAGALGWAVAKWIAPVLVAGLSSRIDRVDLELPTNTTALFFSFAVALASSVLFGLAPAWQASRSEPIQVMRGSSGQAGKLRLGRFFISVQVAFAFGLVILGAAFLFSLRNLSHVDMGFRPQGVTVLFIQSSGAEIAKEAGTGLTRQLRDRVAALPGVTGTAGAGWAVFTGSWMSDQVLVPGKPPSETEELFYPVTDGYFQTLGTPMVAGRDFERGDAGRPDEAPVIVNRAFAAKYFAGLDPLGQRFRYPSEKKPCVIVGVVGNTRYSDLRKGFEPIVYVPAEGLGGMLYVRSATQAPLPVFDHEAQQVRAGLRVSEAYPLETLVNDAILRERLLAVTGGTLGALGMVLAAIGLFGLLNYTVERRTREIGIRAALGAGAGQIVGLVLRETVGMVGFGLAAGLIAAGFVLQALTKLLYGVSPMEPVVVLAGAGVFLLAALVAAGLPARKAAGVDPMNALRVE